MKKIFIDSSKIKVFAAILLSEAKADKIFFYIAEIEEMPRDYLQMIWPSCKDSDIIAEFKSLISAEDFAEFAANYKGKNEYLAYAKIAKKSWLTKRIAEMMKNGQIDKNEEAEIREMLDVVAVNTRKLAFYFFKTFERKCDEEAEEFLKAINEVSIPCKSVPLDSRKNPASNPCFFAK